jgi:hypothetical protein
MAARPALQRLSATGASRSVPPQGGLLPPPPVSQAPVEDLGAAKAVVSTYMDDLRRRSAAMTSAAAGNTSRCAAYVDRVLLIGSNTDCCHCTCCVLSRVPMCAHWM